MERGHATMPSNTTSRRVELFVRSLSPGAPSQQGDVIDQLQALEAAGHLDDLSIQVWGDRIAPAIAQQTASGRQLLDRLTAFERWERDADASLPAFDWRRTVTNLATEESCAVIALPTMALAEYVDGTLAHVAPCKRDGTCYSVADRVSALADLAQQSQDADSDHPTAVHQG